MFRHVDKLLPASSACQLRKRPLQVDDETLPGTVRTSGDEDNKIVHSKITDVHLDTWPGERGRWLQFCCLFGHDPEPEWTMHREVSALANSLDDFFRTCASCLHLRTTNAEPRTTPVVCLQLRKMHVSSHE